MNILFICNLGKNRSKTAAELFKRNHATQAAGIYTNLQEEQLQWADLIIVMEEHQRENLAQNYPKYYLTKQITNINIPDMYNYNNPELKRLLQERIQPLLQP
ncbi:MAG TPA: hypothetical protein VJB87_04435 [Candidatus Nanoarchaeia archaeon]|nr:hypothetical protein [Candidatus Nanoarchaeia archaeon]